MGIGYPHCWRSAYLLHKEDQKLRGLRLTGIATPEVYVSRRFVKDFAGVNCLGFATLQSSNDASLEHICKDICVMSMFRNDIARRENYCFD
jgi:hypothetical protein